MSIKERKLINVIQEFAVDGTVYQLGNMNLTNVIFLARRDRQTFQEIPKSEYIISGEGTSNKTIEIAAAYLTDKVKIQVVEDYLLKSATYDTDLPNINNLKEYFNILVEEFLKVSTITKKHFALSDTKDQPLILPELLPKQVWVTNDQGKLEAMDFTTFSGTVGDIVDGYVTIQKDEFLKFLNEAKIDIAISRDVAIKDLQALANSIKAIVANAEASLLIFNSSIDTRKTQALSQLNTHTEAKKSDLSLHAEALREMLGGSGGGGGAVGTNGGILINGYEVTIDIDGEVHEYTTVDLNGANGGIVINGVELVVEV
ncbi:MAG: hypothetical protein ACRC5T_11275 [Cetobacterium sp.]